jgi:hypothetical protein
LRGMEPAPRNRAGRPGPEMAELILATSNEPLVTGDYLTKLALPSPIPGAAAVYARMITEAALFRDIAADGMPLGDGAADDPSVPEITRYAANLAAAHSASAEDMTVPGPPPQQECAIREERFLAGLIGQQELTDWITLDPGIFHLARASRDLSGGRTRRPARRTRRRGSPSLGSHEHHRPERHIRRPGHHAPDPGRRDPAWHHRPAHHRPCRPADRPRNRPRPSR